MLRISYLWSLILTFLISCQSAENPQGEAILPGGLMGAWVDPQGSIENKKAFVFLPDGKFEWENFESSLEWTWSTNSNLLKISPINGEKTLTFQWEVKNGQLLLDENGSFISLIPRPYGANSNSQLERFDRNIRIINQRLLGKREIIQQIPAPQNDTLVQVLGLWIEGNIPEKLAVTEPAPQEGFSGFSEFFFYGGYLVAFVGPEGNYAFENNKITAWWDPENNLMRGDSIDLELVSRQMIKVLSGFLEIYGVRDTNGRFMKTEKEEASEPNS